MTITDIFDTYGEDTFRRMETECLKELIQAADGQIISVGEDFRFGKKTTGF